MKFLLTVTMLVSSVFASANSDWTIKCFERDGAELELAYKIKVERTAPPVTEQSRRLFLFDCREDMALSETGECEARGLLKKVERQDESCLVLKRVVPLDDMTETTGRSWSLCRQEQESLVDRRLVPVSIKEDRQEARAYCERSILRVL